MIGPGETFIVFLTGAVLLNLTPGPDMAFTLASAVKSGALVLIGVAAGAGALRERLASSARLRARIRTVSALAFGGLGLHLIFARNP